MTTAQGTRRTTSEERREQVIEAGIAVFAEYGLHATKTADIAKRAGISQPYIYALFDDKKALFIACLQRAREQIRDSFAAAWEVRDTPEETLAAVSRNLQRTQPSTEARRCQLQGYAASADPEIRSFMRRGFMEVSDHIAERTGADRATVARFMAAGNLLNLGMVLDLPDEYVSVAL
ncbi:TetR/AcrR family transcriptional regulator [Actinomadura sp.]|jgi:AcrR family transcriptional regulator|uniref:TetR/AcrR family transcriptional regulator n=1 Tax=Actinomadura sp. TaxID=1989 RepID=UPI0033541D1D